MYYTYIQSTNKRKQQHWAEEDTTSELQHSQPLTLRENSKQYPFAHSTYMQTIQPIYTHRRKTNCFERWWRREVFSVWITKTSGADLSAMLNCADWWDAWVRLTSLVIKECTPSLILKHFFGIRQLLTLLLGFSLWARHGCHFLDLSHRMLFSDI